MLKNRTICIKKDYNNIEKSNEKSNTFNSKSLSMTPPHYESDKLNIHKPNVNMSSDIMYHSETNEKIYISILMTIKQIKYIKYAIIKYQQQNIIY